MSILQTIEHIHAHTDKRLRIALLRARRRRYFTFICVASTIVNNEDLLVIEEDDVYSVQYDHRWFDRLRLTFSIVLPSVMDEKTHHEWR